MGVSALFVGFSVPRLRRIVTSLETTSRIRISPYKRDPSQIDTEVGSSDVVFVSNDVGLRRLRSILRRIRLISEFIPTVIVFDGEPRAGDFKFAKEFDCWLYSENDLLARGLTTSELADQIISRLRELHSEMHLLEVSLCCGPCSTGQ